MPDAVINLQDAVQITSAFVIGITWQDGASDGGRPILDYKTTYDKANDEWVEL